MISRKGLISTARRYEEVQALGQMETVQASTGQQFQHILLFEIFLLKNSLLMPSPMFTMFTMFTCWPGSSVALHLKASDQAQYDDTIADEDEEQSLAKPSRRNVTRLRHMALHWLPDWITFANGPCQRTSLCDSDKSRSRKPKAVIWQREPSNISRFKVIPSPLP